MATSNSRNSSSRSRSSASSSRKRDTSLAARTGRTMRDRPYASAAIVAGTASIVAGIAGLLSMKRSSGKSWSEFGDDLTTRASERWSEATERFGEMRHRDGVDPERSQSEIMEEAMTLKETGAQPKGPRGPIAQQDIKAGIATSNQEAKAGVKAVS